MSIPDFANFAREEISHGGPEPELAPIVWLTRDWDDIRKVYAAGVYCSHHCVPTTMVMLQAFPSPEHMLRAGSTGSLVPWLERHWDALPVRNEMRSHRMPEKRARCLTDFAIYAIDGTWRDGDYDAVWADSIKSVKYFGRYVAIKYMEFLRRMARPELVLTDVRAASGAWSVREGLSLIFPESNPRMSDRSDNSPIAIQSAEDYANVLINVVEQHGVRLSHFDAQVLLCEFKQMQRGTFYAGKSHDEEYDFAKIVETRFSIPEFWEARRTLFPASVLRELRDGK